jgi:hypothetical protein
MEKGLLFMCGCGVDMAYIADVHLCNLMCRMVNYCEYFCVWRCLLLLNLSTIIYEISFLFYIYCVLSLYPVS